MTGFWGGRDCCCYGEVNSQNYAGKEVENVENIKSKSAGIFVQFSSLQPQPRSLERSLDMKAERTHSSHASSLSSWHDSKSFFCLFSGSPLEAENFRCSVLVARRTDEHFQ